MTDLAEIEKRLKMAGAYKSVLDKKIVTDTDEDISCAIEDELKDFIKGRLEVLLGVRATPEASAHFTTTEVLILKTLAKRVLTTTDEAEPVEEVSPPTPSLPAPSPAKKKAPVKAQPKPAPKPQKKAPPPEPVVEEEVEVKNSLEEAEVGDIVEENGRRFEVIELNGKKFPKDITKQATSDYRLPMPNLQAAYQQMAYESLAASSDPTTTQLIQAVMAGG